MSSGAKIDLELAREVAEELRRRLLENAGAKRVEIVGSIRRQVPRVGDVELLVEPADDVVGLFGETAPDVESVRREAEEWGTVSKGGDRFIQIQPFDVPEGEATTTIDLFLVHPPADWNVLLAIRTGPAALSRLAVTRMKHVGWRCIDGHLELWDPTRQGWMPLKLENECAFFKAAALPCRPPPERDQPPGGRW